MCPFHCTPQRMWRPHLQTWSRSVSLVVPAPPWLQKSIHQQTSWWEPTMTPAFPSAFFAFSVSCLAHNSYCTTLRMWQCLHIERHVNIHSVLLQVTIGNTDDGTEHPSPPSLEHQSDKFGNASFSFFFFISFLLRFFCVYTHFLQWFKHIFTNVVFKPCPFIFK